MRKYIRHYLKMVKKNKRLKNISVALLILIAAAVVMIIIAAILKNESSKLLTVAISHEPITLDPSYCSCADFETLNNLCFEGLMKKDENGNPVKSGITSYAISEDGLEYTFNISENSKWSNGESVKASDYIYAWERAADETRDPQYAYLFNNIEIVDKHIDENGNIVDEDDEDFSEEYKTIKVMNLEAKDDNTLTVHLKQPDSGFLKKCAMGVFSPVCKEVVEKETRIWGYTGDVFVSNGAYVLSDWDSDRCLTLERNKFHEISDEKSPKNVKVYFCKNNDELIRLFKRGDVLYASCKGAEGIKKYKGKEYFRSFDDYGTFFIAFNQKTEPFNNPKIRHALSLAIDRGKIISSLGDMCANAASSALSGAFKDSDANELLSLCQKTIDVSKKAQKSNVQQAKEILAQAGYPDGEGFPEFSFLFNDNEIHEKVVKMIIEMWRENLGINCVAKNLNFDRFEADRNSHNFTCIRGGCLVAYNDAQTVFEFFTSDKNYYYWNNEKYDAIVKEMKLETDEEKKTKLYIEAENLLMKNDAVCPVYTYTNCAFASKRLKKFYILPSGEAVFNEVIIK